MVCRAGVLGSSAEGAKRCLRLQSWLPWVALSGGPIRCPAVAASWGFVRHVALPAVAHVWLAPLWLVLLRALFLLTFAYARGVGELRALLFDV